MKNTADESIVPTSHFDDYVLVMTSNGLHITGKLAEPAAAAFGRVELANVLQVIVNENGQLGVGPYMFRNTKMTLYPVLVIRFPDLDAELFKALTVAHVKIRSGIHIA